VEKKASLQAKKVLWQGHYLLSPEGWTCNFLTFLEAPKVTKSQTTPDMLGQTDNEISYASFMVSVAQEWRSPLTSSAPVLPLGRIKLDSSGDK
jgi:hypothetical protein